METITTQRLLLRPWALTDAEDMFAYAKDPQVGPNAGWKPHEDVEESKKIITMFVEKDEVWALSLIHI